MRIAWVKQQRLHPHRLWSVLKAARFASYQVQSPLLRGAIDAFRSTAQRSSGRGYVQLSQRSVSFARGTLSGLGCRPAAGPLAVSPVRGAVGFQTARKFSSGGARVFDNLIVNAPLALRLVGDEVEDKAKLSRKKAVSSRRGSAGLSARRTGSTFSGAKLPENALSFACKQRSATTATRSTHSSVPTDLDLYFHFPQLPHPSHAYAYDTVVSMRLVDPLHTELGGRAPSSSDGSRLFDSALLLDVQTAFEYEQVRYLRAKAILRVLWSVGLDHVQLGQERWIVTVKGVRADELMQLLKSEVMFDFDAWCSFNEVHIAGSTSDRSNQDCDVSTPSLVSLTQSSEAGINSLPDDMGSASVSSLYDSRTS